MASKIGQKELKTKWDALTASDNTKKVGHKQNLEARDGTNVLRRNRVGL